MELEEVLKKLETERGWTNTEYLTTMQIELIKDILAIVSNQVQAGVRQKIADFVKQQYKEAWDKMGSTGADDYWETATKDEIFEFGRFRAIEDIKDFLESNFSA